MGKIIDNVFDYLKEHDESRYDNYEILTLLDKLKFSFSVPYIHVTGTNGKGSVATYLSNIYQSAGYKVGLYTSPYFNRVNEQIIVNGKEIDDKNLQSIYSKYKKEIYKYELTEFETLTFIMFHYFMEEACDIAIIEVGMGGEYDATNIDDKDLLSIINNVSLEHAGILGKSISEIAETKAGIIKYEGECLVNIVDDDSKLAIENVAKKQKAKVHYVNEFYRYGISANGRLFVGYYPYSDMLVNTSCISQRENVACAIEALILLKDKFPVDSKNIADGLSKPQQEGRFSTFNIKNKFVIVDGAHNPDAIEKLFKSVNYIKGSLPVNALVGVFRDKNIEKMLALLGSNVDSISLTTFDHPRARTKEEFTLFLEEYKFFDNYLVGINELINTDKEGIVLICGSLYFARLVINTLKEKGEIK